MDVGSISAAAVLTQTARRDQGLSLAMVRQQNAANQTLVAMLGKAADSVQTATDGRGQHLDILV